MKKGFNLSIIGTGYVGLTTGVGFAYAGHRVICMDIDKEKVAKINAGETPVYEPGLLEGLRDAKKKNLIEATDDLEYAITNSDITFITVPTPEKKDGSCDLSFVEQVSKDIGRILREKEGYHVVAVKSTVIPETTERVVIPNLEEYSGKIPGEDFGVCVNPEFLREGSALRDFLKPDRIVIGELNTRSGDILEMLHRDFGAPILRTSLKVAEMIKYASNSFLATKISFANEIGNICKRLGIDVYEVMKGLGLDKRISPHFLRAGLGFGGSCFPKDVNALIHKAETLGYEPRLLKEVMKINQRQPYRIIDLLRKRLGSIKGREIAVLGLAFKPDTDDIREAVSIKVVSELLKSGAEVRAYDPKAVFNFRKLFPNITYCESARDALKGSDACLVLTEWPEFRELTDEDFSSMRERIIIEGGKALNPNRVKGFEGICW
ncbi:MAG TPA: UDP-glucose/GDP-mannose dehydrogenase family protein [Candidatus Aenigmarchaeota archaeon]|nr:UDP-glucose/GDP-mannose dehydrogenase family protein [Candidatus Aenigmarchaeota archaeon]